MKAKQGSGGRMPRALPFTGTTATRELIEEFGHPHDEPARGCQMLRFDLYPSGAGLLLARLSGRELQGGETAMGQVHACRALANAESLRPRAVIVTIGNSGARSFNDRPDLQLAKRAIEEGWLKWVIWRDPIRLARELMPAEEFYALLREHSVGLYFASMGRAVNWRQDRLAIRTLNMLGAEEREWIAERTHAALHSRYVDEGRGWPGTKRFGIRRHWATKELEVDPIQWEFAKRIHYGFADLGADGITGIRLLRERLLKLGCELSVEEIRTILRDPIYVTGEYSVRIAGVETPQKPVPLADPIPAAVFAFNQQLLGARKGKNTRTAVGEFLLSAVEFSHRPCRDLRNKDGARPLLRGRREPGRKRLAYRHLPWVPKACYGLVLDRDNIDPPVLKQLLALAGNPALQAAWLAAEPVPAFSASGELLDENARKALRQRIRQRRRQKAQLTRTFLERGDADGTVEAAAYWELVAAISEEIEDLEARLASVDGSVAPPAAPAAAELRAAMAEVLVETPGSDGELVRRSALVAALLREVVVDEVEPGVITVELVTALSAESGVELIEPHTKHDNRGGMSLGDRGDGRPAI
jgi:DNA invertase Pin-like site-specific DNA recombinase